MEVILRPAMRGCLAAIVTVATLGVYRLIAPMGERHFIRRMDEAGFETRGGKRYAWRDITRIEHVAGTVNNVQLSDEYVAHTARGRVSLPLWRIENRQEARDFFLRQAPQPP